MRWLLFCTVERKNWCQTDMMYTPLMPIGCVTPQNWCQTRGCCRNPELNLRCRGMVCNSLVMQTSTRICNVFFAHFCKCLAIANYQALGLTHLRMFEFWNSWCIGIKYWSEKYFSNNPLRLNKIFDKLHFIWVYVSPPSLRHSTHTPKQTSFSGELWFHPRMKFEVRVCVKFALITWYHEVDLQVRVKIRTHKDGNSHTRTWTLQKKIKFVYMYVWP